ncbi:MAG: UDP-N-acetylglucosamine 2-epimerase (non-hydrolyzing) [Phototrophicales bacterium]|nr:MAG: UDP-N-acetylglucosamine 2-epimerase (non-hydrolyzing) [Phototrophicales bacterium]RMG73462.1 MAG: UDP-N-acetylglucosamine 2-epimerase (non-hydrolyzing) [Chloroflexota bacterium]
MKVLTILGTRPEIIRLSRVIALLDTLCDHVLVHTGQNFDFNLNDVFFQQLGVREADHYMNVQADSFGSQIGQILTKTEHIIREEKPDRVLILGDTNSALSAIIAKRMGIPVYHMEAGNRCYDDRVPEEVNRRIIDHASDILMPYTHRSKDNLIREGIERHRIYVTGNPIYEVLEHYQAQIDASSVLDDMGLKAGEFFLVTMHRAENVDEKARLIGLIEGLQAIGSTYQQPVVVSLHPRTKSKLERFHVKIDETYLRFMTPLPFFEFVKLEKTARCVISDSGTVQEECAIFGVPNVTIRDVTERAETVEVGSNILAGGNKDDLLRAVNVVLNTSLKWEAPEEYLVADVSRTVVKIVLGYHFIA